MEAAILEFWRNCLDSLSPVLDQESTPSGVFSFGDSKKLADELAALTRQQNRNVLDTDELQRAKVLFYRPV